MRPLVQLKQDVEFNASLGGIIDVLKIAASVQLRQLQAREPLSKEFLAHLQDCFAMLHPDQVQHPFLREREDLPACVVVITSEEGFAGELNTLLVNAALDAWDAARGDTLVVLGERGASSLEERNVSFVRFPGVTEAIEPAEVDRLKRYLIREYLLGRWGKILVIYARFLNVSSQRVEQETVLPQRLAGGSVRMPEPPLIAPSQTQVIEGLINRSLSYLLHQIFWQSKLSECAARLMHLEASSQELSRINQQLALQYARHLHALADKAIREISASRLCMVGAER